MGAYGGPGGCGWDIPVGIFDDTLQIPLKIKLFINYPNPFNATNTISYALPLPSHVTIDIYNILGRKVETLVNKHQTAGYHQAI